MLSEKLQQQVARGFRAIKMGWRPFGRVSRKLDELLIKTARETVGDDVELMVDAGGSEQFWPHGVCWARETAKMLGDYQITWFEEALKPDDVEGFKELRQTSPVLIATGEVFTRRQTFQPFITQRALDIIQPDLTKCGGLSEGRRLGWMAYDHGVLLVPHGWNTAIGVAADLALTAAMPVARWVEYQTGVPYIEELILPAFKLDKDGMLPVPTGPGLGSVESRRHGEVLAVSKSVPDYPRLELQWPLVGERLMSSAIVQPHSRKRRTRIWIAAIAIVLIALPLIAWWVMIRMPGESFQGELPALDDPQTTLAR